MAARDVVLRTFDPNHALVKLHRKSRVPYTGSYIRTFAETWLPTGDFTLYALAASLHDAVSTAMPPKPHVSINNIKRFAKLVKTRFAIGYLRALETIGRASSYEHFNIINLYIIGGGDVVRFTLSDYPAWLRRLGFELGSDLQELLSEDELRYWFCRVHCVPRPKHLDDSAPAGSIDDRDRVGSSIAGIQEVIASTSEHAGNALSDARSQS